jgi:hypothetical protein
MGGMGRMGGLGMMGGMGGLGGMMGMMGGMGNMGKSPFEQKMPKKDGFSSFLKTPSSTPNDFSSAPPPSPPLIRKE